MSWHDACTGVADLCWSKPSKCFSNLFPGRSTILLAAAMGTVAQKTFHQGLDLPGNTKEFLFLETLRA